MLQQAITTALETNQKMESLGKVILKEPNELNYKTKKHNNQNKNSLDGLNSRMEVTDNRDSEQINRIQPT